MSVSDFNLVGQRPKIMGVLNVTPDSFSDAGSYFAGSLIDCSVALQRAETMLDEGAAFIDVGGESTKPGAVVVSVQQELDRVIPVVEALGKRLDCIVSVDTSSPEVIAEAAMAGAKLINDVRALRREGALQALVKTQLSVCLMHMQGEPCSMQNNPCYQDVVGEVTSFFQQRVIVCNEAGINSNRIILDPGFGFGKTLRHNLQLFNQLNHLKIDNLPLLIGVSRKSMIGQVLEKQVDQRLMGGVALAAIAVMKGVSIIRTHDVAATQDAVKMAYAVTMGK